MNLRKLIVLFLFISTVAAAQDRTAVVADPQKKDFTGVLGFLSSDWMEGREAGTKGSFLAADYIASRMVQSGLSPAGEKRTNLSMAGYFQDFEILSYRTGSASLSLISNIGNSRIEWTQGVDFEVEAGPINMEATAEVVFGGYGITSPGKEYDDYNGLEVNGAIVMMMDGYPGQRDTLSPARKIFAGESSHLASLESKIVLAMKKGVVAIILVKPDGFQPYRSGQVNRELLNHTINRSTEDPEYADCNHSLPGDSVSIPVFRVTKALAQKLLDGSNISLVEAEKLSASKLKSPAKPLKGIKVACKVEMKVEPMIVRNVLGMIPGKDTTRNIVIGAHYDHLGIRGNLIYNGSDDNASGVAGMLAIADAWVRAGVKPSCNLVFAAWTAEEKGLLGSTWFVRNFNFSKQSIDLNINFDMISRSDPADKEAKIISIGFLKGTENLKSMAREYNKRLVKPFELDIWETTGHGGSDYVPFAMRKIPVMSFFSGFHSDYHSPRDVYAKADLYKMQAILALVNQMITEIALSDK
ncbi:MAG: M20/M25/M40 family metallo-hydrolase [Lentimicrobium sp.]|nr:M20/M25/M40 family metallo-hydrolase [Lentimicrobium sp.]